MVSEIERIRKSVQSYLNFPEIRARLIFLLTLIVLMVVWWLGMQWFRAMLLEERRGEVSEEVALRGSALSSAINRRFSLLRGLDAFIKTESHYQDFEHKFMRYAANLHSSTSGLHNIVVAPDGVIQYIYPPEGNEHLLGYDLLTAQLANLREEIDVAIDSGEIILGFPLNYAQEEWGLSARKAVFMDNGYFWGMVIIVIDLPTLLDDSGLSIEVPDLDFRLENDSGAVIYETGPIGGKEGVMYNLGLPEEPWELSGYPKEDWELLIRRELLPAQFSSLVIVLLFSGLVYATVNRQARLSEAVKERTREIAQINSSLELRMAERTRELSTLMEISQDVASIADIDPLVSLILDKLQELVTCIATALFIKIDDSTLQLLTYRGPIPLEELPTLWPIRGAAHYQEILHQRKVVILPDIYADTPLAVACRNNIAAQLSDTHYYFQSWMGVPLMVKTRVIGLMVFHHHESGFFKEEAANLAMAFGQQAALAIENARLYEQSQQVAVLRERQRIARDLHDSVSQALYSIALGANTAKTLVERKMDAEERIDLLDPINHVLGLADAGLAEMRSLIFELRPESLENEGFIDAIDKLIVALRARHGLEIELNACDEPQLPIDSKLALYRITQEALHNIVKHAQAQKIDVQLRCHGDRVSLKIHDDGRGFNPTLPSSGLGLRSMKERVNQYNGTLDIRSSSGEGTLISVQIPIPKLTPIQ